ncbi:MAG: type II secretion system protein, partial [Candidatus Pacebacteria bacterium]|nr:type II secretion system protein [Candidatus Paceibacterota bacterium]
MKTKSFTLIELLVVIVIIGILAGVIIVSTSSSINKANLAKAQSFSNTVQNELLLNLVSEWTFDEGGAEDTWGNNDATLGDGATSTTYPTLVTGDNCISGSCMSFDGGDYVTVASNGLNKFSAQSFTISEWFKPNTIQNYILLWSYDYTSHVSPYYAQHLRVEQTG